MTTPCFPPPALPPGCATQIVASLFHEKDHFGKIKCRGGAGCFYHQLFHCLEAAQTHSRVSRAAAFWQKENIFQALEAAQLAHPEILEQDGCSGTAGSAGGKGLRLGGDRCVTQGPALKGCTHIWRGHRVSENDHDPNPGGEGSDSAHGISPDVPPHPGAAGRRPRVSTWCSRRSWP